MSIENFKNPWVDKWKKGGEFDPDWLGEKKALEKTALSNEFNTVKVYSGLIDKNGKKISENVELKPQEMLLLFSTNVDKVLMGEEHLSFSDFNNQYQTVAQHVTSTYNEKIFAQFVSANKEIKYFSLAVKTVTLAELNSVRKRAVNFLNENKNSSKSWLKYNYFNHGSQFDIKADGKLLDGQRAIYIDGVGVFTNDFVGNLFYGSVWANFQVLERTLYDGDFLQKRDETCPYDGSDDPYDSYALMLGHMYARDEIKKSSFNAKVTMTKKVTAQEVWTKDNYHYEVTNFYFFKFGTWKSSIKTQTRSTR